MTAVEVGAPLPHAHHESAEERHVKEFLAILLFIGGDIVFTGLEVFTWIYLRALNVDGMWRGAACTTANPCTNGNGGNITHEIATANAAYPVLVAVLVVAAAAVCWGMERNVRAERPFGGLVAISSALTLAAIVVLAADFAVLPFTTVDGAYASGYEFVAASTLAHLIIMLFVLGGMGNRARLGLYGERRWHRVRIIKIFATWIAVSTVLLTVLVVAFT